MLMIESPRCTAGHGQVALIHLKQETYDKSVHLREFDESDMENLSKQDSSKT